MNVYLSCIATVLVMFIFITENNNKMTSERDMQVSQTRDIFFNLLQISKLLSTGLDSESLGLCIRLCELGINPEALATVIKEIRQMAEVQHKNKPIE